MEMIVIFSCGAEFSLYHTFLPIIILSSARDFFNWKEIKCVKKVDCFISHNPLVIHLSQSSYNKFPHQNIKNDSLSDHFRPQFSVAFLTKQTQLLMYPYNSFEFRKTHLSSFGHWSWSTFTYELYQAQKFMGQPLNVHYSMKNRWPMF